jgi:Uma2 family endonuclease
MASIPAPTHPSTPAQTGLAQGEPTWEIALLYPMQGTWSEEEYLLLTDGTNWLIEYTSGRIEVLPMPTIEHQLMVRFLLDILRAFVEPRHLGMVLFAPTRVYVKPDKFREPDIVFNFTENHAKSGKRFYQTADLVMEVISDDPESRKRDLEIKPIDYARGGIPEYWIVDPIEKQITVLALEGDHYVQHGRFTPGQQADSRLLDGLVVDVESVFQAAKS